MSGFICPYCNIAIAPNAVMKEYQIVKSKECESLEISSYLYICPNCKNSVLVKEMDNKLSEIKVEIYPKSYPSLTAFPNAIHAISSSFIEIYHQAEVAEYHDLDKIAGLGYRKSLEFLIKDYILFKTPEHANKIKRLPLAQCVEQFLDDDKLKSLVTATTWLGNDETHYSKRHPYYDIDDLKLFLEAVVQTINLQFTLLRANTLINN